MPRLVPLGAALAALLAVFFLPEVPRAKLAAQHAHALLEERVGPAPAEGEADTRPTLASLVLAGPATEVDAAGTRRLKLYGVQLAAEAAAKADIVHHLETRRSLVRGLRRAAEEAGMALVIDGEAGPVVGGATFYVQLIGDELVVRYLVDGAPLEPVILRTTWRGPGRASLAPPLLAVVLALLLRSPILALAAGVLAGTTLVRRAGGAGDLAARLSDELVDGRRGLLVLAILLLATMVALMARTGGLRGLLDAVAPRARTPRRAQLVAWVMGATVSLDHSASALVTGAAMRPLTDRLRVSREKLAWIIDGTTASLAAISVVGSWIALEVGAFRAHLPAAGLRAADAYDVFLRSIPYCFYGLLTLVLVGAVALSGRDLGAMLVAERRARESGRVLREGARPLLGEPATRLESAPGVVPRAWRAAVPLLTVIAVFGGTQSAFRGAAWPLAVSALAGFLVAAVSALAVIGGAQLVGAIVRTLCASWRAIVLLYLAWMLTAVCTELGTAPYLAALLGDSVDARLLPTLLCLLAGAIAFATGSWLGTLSVLLPLVVALAYNLGLGAGLAPTGPESGVELLVICIGSVVSGTLCGGHCSPLAQTTVLSSIAAAADHVDHVRTQAPYALWTLLVAIVAGYLPCAYLGLSPWLALLLGAALLVGFFLLRGERVEVAAA